MQLSEDINSDLPRISVSSGSSFRKCSLSYHFNKELGGIRGSAATFGTSCHSAASAISNRTLVNEEQVRKFILNEFKKNMLLYLFKIEVDPSQKVDTSGDPDEECDNFTYEDPFDHIEELHIPLGRNLAIKYWANN